jgi:hypothetical protein
LERRKEVVEITMMEWRANLHDGDQEVQQARQCGGPFELVNMAVELNQSAYLCGLFSETLF